jgi:MoxR-like ATPase
MTASGFVASRDLLQVWETVLATRDEAGHSPMMYFVGPSGSGKTHAASYLAEVAGMPFTKIDCPSMTDAESWFGTREVIAKDGVPVTEYRPSGFIEAIQRPGVTLLDEFNRATDAVRGILLALFDGTHQVTNPLTGETVHKHPECVVILSGNVGLQFTGTYAVDPAFTTRSLTIPFSYLGAEDEQRVVIERIKSQGLEPDADVAKLFVRFANETRQRAGTTDPDMNPVSTREVILAASLAANGLPVDLAASVAIINSASDEGGQSGVKDRLVQIWTGIRPSK